MATKVVMAAEVEGTFLVHRGEANIPKFVHVIPIAILVILEGLSHGGVDLGR